jgi:CheY-like chemotaxis protein
LPFSPSNPPRRRLSNPPSLGERPRILYVEDDDLIWDVTETALSERYIIHRAKNAEEAFSMLARSTYHLILMDIQLQGSDLDGITITRILKGLHRGPAHTYGDYLERLAKLSPSSVIDGVCCIPIVFVTAYAGRDRKQDLLDAGAEEIIVKPVNFTRLSLLIARIWARGAHDAAVDVARTPPRG